MKLHKPVITTAILLIITACGTQTLRPNEYIEIGRGEKALLITTNNKQINPGKWFYELMFWESYYEENVFIKSIDNKRVKTNHLKLNQHVLIDPGPRIVEINCLIIDKDKPEKRVSGKAFVRVNFRGGYKYEAKIKSIEHPDCIAEIKPVELNNTSRGNFHTEI